MINVPDGWKLVPVEPTREMKIAGDNAGFWCGDKYAAMLAASPQPVVQTAFDIALDALAEYQRNWDTGLPAEYAQTERIAMECAVEAVREALHEAQDAQQVALTDEQAEDLQEAREILENMVRSVELDGNYSTEATCTFLRQALQCLPAVQPASGDPK
jgi:SpoVK/Ycf46/Vps4 family AAA+-type ATPase